MNREPTDWDEEWDGLEPDQPPGVRNWMLVGMVLTVLLLILLCLLGLYGGVRQLEGRTGDEQLLPPSVGNSEENDGEESADPPSNNDPPLAATVTLPGGPPEGEQTGSSQVVAVRLTTAPTLNADLSDWPEGPTAVSSHVVHRSDGVTRSPSAQAVWRLGWDEDNLYVGTAVTDDIHVQTQQGNQIFRGDSLELQIETNPTRNARTLGPTNFQIALSPGNFGDIPPSAFRFQGDNQGRMLDASGGHNITVAARQTGDGYILEAAIPWSDLNLTPTPGIRLGLALNLNDNDNPGSARQEMMLSNVSTRQFADPTSWGTLTLQE
jgi:hypothetical protein